MLYWERMSFFYMQNKTADLRKKKANIHKIYFLFLKQKYRTHERIIFYPLFESLTLIHEYWIQMKIS